MARSLSNAKLVSAAIADGLSLAINRRGFSAVAPQGGAAAAAAVSAARGGGIVREKAKETIAWIPDPKTGYYRPENKAEEIDVAELRQMLLNNNNKKSRRT
ncbi:hypothetical protein Sjap_007449 [Stephania japonica]|uniref:Uncharacterized protein n=1 Tax=Stephania japonica TaxID=461633 RepID=A0AAP0PDQ9_9MAGN